MSRETEDSASVLVLFGTQTGNSELLAEAIGTWLEDAGIEAPVMDMSEAYPELLEEYKRLIVVLCTWADGTFPDNAVAFWESLLELKPDCTGMRFGIVALGDRLYDPYYQVAAYALDDHLRDLGAARVAPHFEIDGAVRPSHRRRLKKWVDEIRNAFEAHPAR